MPVFIQLPPDQLVYKGLLKDKKRMTVKKQHPLVSKIILLFTLKVKDLTSIYQDTMVISVVTSTYVLTEYDMCILSLPP